MSNTFENRYKVRLIPISSLIGGEDPDTIRASQVAFDVTPQFAESRSAEYSAVTPVHMPGAIQVYKHTNSRNFEIGAMLISRTVADARRNMANLQKLRGWLLPYFGAGSSTLTDAHKQARANKSRETDASQTQADRIKNEGVELRGAPPDVLYLYAYSTSGNDLNGSREQPRMNINRVPVVMTSLNITYPDDVDYIPVYPEDEDPSSSSEPFPVKMQISVSLLETHSPREYENFNLQKFKQGNLISF